LKDNLPSPIIKPAVQYAAHDFRNLTRTLLGTVSSVDSFVVAPVVVRRVVFPNGSLNEKYYQIQNLECFF
jgi:hypothetical protein